MRTVIVVPGCKPPGGTNCVVRRTRMSLGCIGRSPLGKKTLPSNGPAAGAGPCGPAPNGPGCGGWPGHPCGCAGGCAGQGCMPGWGCGPCGGWPGHPCGCAGACGGQGCGPAP